MRIADTSVPVVVVTVSPNPLLHSSIGVARSLGRLGVRVHAVHPPSPTPADHSRHLAGRTVVSLDDSAPQRFLDDLFEVGGGLGRRSILIPVDDRGALFVADHAEALKDWFIFPEQDPALVHGLSNKRELYLLCKQLGVPTAETLFPQSRDEILAFLEQARFPMVVKAIDPRLLAQRKGAKSVVIVQDAAALLDAYDGMEVAGQPNLMLQEYIPGRADSVWMFNGYFDTRSECLVAFTGTKLRQCPPHTGAASLGVCRSNPVVEETTKEFLGAVGYKGIVDLGYRYDDRDGRYKLLDVNPRIGSTFRLFVGTGGIDVARALYLDLTGQLVSASRACDGRKWVVEHNDLVASARYYHRGELSLSAWLRSFRGVHEGAWFAWDDPAPFAAMCWEALKLALRRLEATPTSASAPLVADESPQRQVTKRFETYAQFWQDLYQGDDVFSVIHRHRQALTLGWIDQLDLPPGSQVLEVGSGAGYTTVALAQRGFHVDAMDATPRLLEMAHRRFAQADVDGHIRAILGDVHRLPFADSSFDLVVALGVVPWLHSPAIAVAQMARVLRPGGHLLFNADNRQRLNRLLDPLHTPALQPLKSAAKAILGAMRVWRPKDRGTSAIYHRLAEFDALIAAAGLERLEGTTFGFGPFTLLNRQMLPRGVGVRVHDLLQRLADRGAPMVRSMGAQYLVLARKPA
jgi:D-aspartate ligase